jgi:uncharacterized protein (TIGR02391 family)
MCTNTSRSTNREAAARDENYNPIVTDFGGRRIIGVMPDSIDSLVQDPELLLAMEPEELGAVMLEALQSCQPNTRQRNNFFIALGKTKSGASADINKRIMEAFAEGWSWLVSEGLIAEIHDSDQGFMFITRRGKDALRAGAPNYLRAKLLPRTRLHPRIQQRVTAAFLRGEYDVAVLQAFKQVEIAVRSAGNFPTERIGVDLMRQAFKSGGPLHDAAAHAAEEEALGHLFAGAIGFCKNPNSHRDVEVNASEAVELVMLACWLLRMVEQRGTGVMRELA